METVLTEVETSSYLFPDRRVRTDLRIVLTTVFVYLRLDLAHKHQETSLQELPPKRSVVFRSAGARADFRRQADGKHSRSTSDFKI